MKLKRFNEDIDDSMNFNEDEFDTDDIFESEIFREIETDIESMLENDGEAEAIDYLSSIIAFCNQQIKSIEQEEE
jgi:hypothetical protein